jgi:hypothetical protein
MATKFKDTTKPHYRPTAEQRSQVDAMAAYGVPEVAIAKVLKIAPKTLRKHFRDELDTAHVKANSAVAQSLYRKATSDGPQSVTAAIFWAKTRMGWRETPTEHRHSGAVGSYDLSRVSDADLDRIEAVLARASVASGNTGGDSAAED